MNKIVINVQDSQNTNNIGGFNLANFKLRYVDEYMKDVISDYEQSFIGSFIVELINKIENSKNSSSSN